jgi:hypothetical protein
MPNPQTEGQRYFVCLRLLIQYSQLPFIVKAVHLQPEDTICIADL